MQIAILTFDGFNELDCFVPATILNRMKVQGWAAYITSPAGQVTSMNGVVVRRQKPLEFATEADAVLIGSGVRSRELANDAELLSRIRLDPSRQLIGAQCSGTLLLARLGLIGDLPACTDLATKPWVIEAGVEVLDAPFVAHGNVATAGGCLASQYLATWMIAPGRRCAMPKRRFSPLRRSVRNSGTSARPSLPLLRSLDMPIPSLRESMPTSSVGRMPRSDQRFVGTHRDRTPPLDIRRIIESGPMLCALNAKAYYAARH